MKKFQENLEEYNKSLMNIAIINHNPKEKGTYFRCFGFARELVKNKHNVVLFCFSPNKNIITKKYKENGIDIIELPFILAEDFLG